MNMRLNPHARDGNGDDNFPQARTNSPASHAEPDLGRASSAGAATPGGRRRPRSRPAQRARRLTTVLQDSNANWSEVRNAMKARGGGGCTNMGIIRAALVRTAPGGDDGGGCDSDCDGDCDERWIEREGQPPVVKEGDGDGDVPERALAEGRRGGDNARARLIPGADSVGDLVGDDDDDGDDRSCGDDGGRGGGKDGCDGEQRDNARAPLILGADSGGDLVGDDDDDRSCDSGSTEPSIQLLPKSEGRVSATNPLLKASTNIDVLGFLNAESLASKPEGPTRKTSKHRIAASAPCLKDSINIDDFGFSTFTDGLLEDTDGTPNNSGNPNDSMTSDDGFKGWVARCFSREGSSISDESHSSFDNLVDSAGFLHWDARRVARCFSKKGSNVSDDSLHSSLDNLVDSSGFLHWDNTLKSSGNCRMSSLVEDEIVKKCDPVTTPPSCEAEGRRRRKERGAIISSGKATIEATIEATIGRRWSRERDPEEDRDWSQHSFHIEDYDEEILEGGSRLQQGQGIPAVASMKSLTSTKSLTQKIGDRIQWGSRTKKPDGDDGSVACSVSSEIDLKSVTKALLDIRQIKDSGSEGEDSDTKEEKNKKITGPVQLLTTGLTTLFRTPSEEKRRFGLAWDRHPTGGSSPTDQSTDRDRAIMRRKRENDGDDDHGDDDHVDIYAMHRTLYGREDRAA